MQVTLQLTGDAGAIQAALNAFNSYGSAKPAKTVAVVDAEPGERLPVNHGATGNPPPEASYSLPSESSAESAREAIQAYAKSAGIPAAQNLLKEFGVARVAELTDGHQRFNLVARIHELLSK